MTTPAPRPFSLRIERLSLAGLPLSRGDARQLGAAMEAELGVLAADPTGWRGSASAVPALAPLTLAVHPGMAPADMGRALARALFAAVSDAP